MDERPKQGLVVHLSCTISQTLVEGAFWNDKTVIYDTYNSTTTACFVHHTSLHQFYIIAHTQNVSVSVFIPIKFLHVLSNGLEKA